MTARMIAERWLYNELQSTGVPIHQAPAPEGTAFPHITFTPITGLAGGPMNNLHQVQNLRYQVNAYDKGTSAMGVHRLGIKIMEALAGAKSTQLTFTHEGVTYNGTMNGCQFRGIVPIPIEIVDGITYQRNGNEFEIQVLLD